MEVKFLSGELWYGSCVKYGVKMPFDEHLCEDVDFTMNKTPNQAMPLLLSSLGRVLYSENGFCASFKNGVISVPDSCILTDTKNNLRSAYMFAVQNYMNFNGEMPASELFENPIYNTWIELTFYQNQKDVLDYADKIKKNNMPSGVIMIDDGWSECYGDWRFHSGKFPNAKEMIDKLHIMGFKVMLWVCPFISADSIAFRETQKLDILVKTDEEMPFISKWWNGYSAVLDFEKPEAETWLKNQLDNLVKLGIDGFKFDAGDSIYYKNNNDKQSKLWALFGCKYKFNEYRITFGAAGLPLLQRLCDKQHSWDDDGVKSLVPDTLLQGITGHIYSCPDMIGGGEYLNFQDMSKSGLDEELFVRHAEAACLMPAMQFSAAPYRVLGKESFDAIKKSIQTRNEHINYIMQLITEGSKSGEPVVRYMEYEYPNQGFGYIIDQFMLGNMYIVAPIYKKGDKEREVAVPKGEWLFENKKIKSDGETMIFCPEYGKPVILKKVI